MAIVYRVCQHWRVPVFQRLAATPEFELRVFHSEGIPGTKVVNGENLGGFEHTELRTWSGALKVSGRNVCWLFCPGLYKELKRFSPDVVVTEGGSNIFNNFLVFLYCRLAKRPYVWWTLGEIPGRKHSGLGKVYRKAVAFLEKRATALLGYSSVAIQYFRNQGYEDRRQFKAVNCVVTDRVLLAAGEAKSKRSQMRSRFGDRDVPIVLFVGALTIEKKIDRLLKAFANLKRDAVDARLILVGGGEDAARLRNLAEKFGIGESTFFTGPVVDGVAEYFQAADIYVLPGLGGLAISEAMCHGLPVLCSRGDGCEVDLVGNGVSGKIVDPQLSEEELINEYTAVLKEWLTDERERRRLGEGAIKTIQYKYNINSYIQEIVRAINFASTEAQRTSGHQLP